MVASVNILFCLEQNGRNTICAGGRGIINPDKQWRHVGMGTIKCEWIMRDLF